MRNIFILFTIISINFGCAQSQNAESTMEITTVILDESDKDYGYYLSVLPKGEMIKGAVVLFPGFSQKAEDIFMDSKLHEYAYENNLLTIGFSTKYRLTADSLVREKLTTVLKHVLAQHKVDPNHFFLGGFSAGGVIALRYAELCKEFSERFPIQPKGVFMADSPVDLYHSWASQQENLKNNYSKIAVDEAKFIGRFFKQHYGNTPSEKPSVFVDLSPFSINEEWGSHEKQLKDVAIRAYHDVDVAWRLVNRNQTARFDNYIATSELINRLLLMGNTKAEFIQTFETGYRRNGDRHPHSWSIIDEKECIEWIGGLLE